METINKVEGLFKQTYPIAQKLIKELNQLKQGHPIEEDQITFDDETTGTIIIDFNQDEYHIYIGFDFKSFFISIVEGDNLDNTFDFPGDDFSQLTGEVVFNLLEKVKIASLINKTRLTGWDIQGMIDEDKITNQGFIMDAHSMETWFLYDRSDKDVYHYIDEIMRTLHYDNGEPLTTNDYNYFDHYDRDQDFYDIVLDEIVHHVELDEDGNFKFILNIDYRELEEELTNNYDGSSYEHDFGTEY